MIFRHTLSRRDAFLVLFGASTMHIWSVLTRQTVMGQSIVIDTQYHNHNIPLEPPNPPLDPFHIIKDLPPTTITETALVTETNIATSTIVLQPSSTPSAPEAHPPDIGRDFPHTSIISHAPGWTLFRNLYMSNGTLYILSSNRSFPEIRMMTSTGLEAFNTPENIASREPTAQNMDFITPEEAHKRWGGDLDRGEKNRVWSVEGNTLLFNDPGQFLRHYYHLVAELFFGTWAFWHGAWSKPTTSLAASYSLTHASPPPIHRAIFAHSNADGWRDSPGFNAYFLRAAFPSLTVEVQEDWADRIAATAGGKDNDRAWHFPIVLLTDRSAAHRGAICGSQTQRTASEAWEFMKQNNQLMGSRVGGWWQPVREAVWRFAGTPLTLDPVPSPDLPELSKAEDSLALPMPDKIIITYISRQGVSRRKLIPEDHDNLVLALQELVARKGDSWRLDILQAEKLTKDEQVQAAARTTILLGVHGNGLTHLVFMKPTRVSAVIELFYPGGFAQDYHWTSRALGMDHFAVWNDKYITHPTKPEVSYPEGFQGNSIPVHGPTVAKLIEDHIESKSQAP
ncbi:hypothetical protein BDZ94DRAFT_1154259 [Collybia nuda]|uniref:Glycosyltransferase 61 catalytic domain-containing protein n=1 Tax=Collybia nuda TaxID=64659 RepID=A0A9P5YG73_9AGAR|nr:hypothetical protein BDZ94DRAFT_1154259 [Collybia nuda]